jgi:hypothetical protein
MVIGALSEQTFLFSFIADSQSLYSYYMYMDQWTKVALFCAFVPI